MFVPREAVLCFALTAMVLQCGLQVAEAQEQPKTPKSEFLLYLFLGYLLIYFLGKQ